MNIRLKPGEVGVWVSVKDRMPPIRSDIYVYAKFKYHDGQMIHEDVWLADWGWAFGENEHEFSEYFEEPTHWMLKPALPDPPVI